MKIQTSFHNESKGILYVVPTPIGNLQDMTFRAVDMLKAVSIIAAEDTRNTSRLLNYFEVQTGVISYHEHNKVFRGKELLERLADGQSIALVSDAGMPAISDPGEELVQAAIENECSVVVLPGANAALCALVGSGLPAGEFLFYGFLPRKKQGKQAEIKRIGLLSATVLLYESPYRLLDTLALIEELLGDRNIAVARELTKKFEEYMRGLTSEVIDWLRENGVKGECCIVIEGLRESVHTNNLWWSHLSIVQHIAHYMDIELYSSKEAIKKVARERNLPKQTVYKAYHVE